MHIRRGEHEKKRKGEIAFTEEGERGRKREKGEIEGGPLIPKSLSQGRKRSGVATSLPCPRRAQSEREGRKEERKRGMER
jgi:hypothetical protein